MSSFSIRQYFWENTSEKISLIYLFSIRQYFWTYISGNKFQLCIRFQLGNTFGNIQVKKISLIYSFSIRQYFWEYIGEKKIIAGKELLFRGGRGGPPPY